MSLKEKAEENAGQSCHGNSRAKRLHSEEKESILQTHNKKIHESEASTDRASRN